MNTDQVNYLNIGLMILSCVVAFILPFELFLFSYAVLGPLHYLTEMSWLHKKRFFSPGKNDYLLLGMLALVILFPILFRYVYNLVAVKNAAGNRVYSGVIAYFLTRSLAFSRAMLFVSFATAAVLVLIRNVYKRLAAISFIILAALFFRSAYFINIIFAIFLPTLIHVFIFTGMFLLTGALKSKSLSGTLSVLVFVGCAVSLFVLFPHPVNTSGVYVLKNYDVSFLKLNRQIFETFMHQKNASRNDIYYSNAGILITRFIAYAYTYHYLNWFSKTSVIKWHLLPRRSLVVILLLWGLSLVLYFTSYRVGLVALYFLSMLHVIFEFPLNVQSFRELGSHFRRRKAIHAPANQRS